MGRTRTLILLLCLPWLVALRYPSLCGDATDPAECAKLDFDALTNPPVSCAVGYCVAGLVEGTTNEWDCQPCSGGGSVPTPTAPAATLTATPTPTVNVCGAIPNCVTPTATPTVTVTPTATSTPPPTATVTATPTTTTTPVVCATDALGRGGVIAAHPEQCGVPVVTASPTPTATLTSGPTATQTLVACPTDAMGRGGVIAAHPEQCGAPIATPTSTAATPTYTVPFPTPTGDWVRKDSAATDPQVLANALQIAFTPIVGTHMFSMLPSSEPLQGEEVFSIYARSSRDPIMQIQARDDTTGSVHHIGMRLDRGTDTGSFAATTDAKPWQIIMGTAASPYTTSNGLSGMEFASQVLFADVDLELGNIQSYITVDAANTQPFFSVGVGSNVSLSGTGGDGVAWSGFNVPASGFKTFISIGETGSITRHVSSFTADGDLRTKSGTAAQADYFGFTDTGLDVNGCTSPSGTCIDLVGLGGFRVANNYDSIGPTSLRYSLKSECVTCQLRQPGSMFVGSPTPTATPTTTAATITPTPTVSSTPTTTSTAASPTPTSASPTPTPAPVRTEVPHTVFQNDVRLNGAVINLPQTIKMFEGVPATNAARFAGGGQPNAFCSPVALPMPYPGCAERLICNTNGKVWPGTYDIRLTKSIKRQFSLNGTFDANFCTLSGVADPSSCIIDYAPEQFCWAAEDRLCMRVGPSGVAPSAIGLNCTLVFRQR